MAINSINYGSLLLGQSVLNLKNQLADLSDAAHHRQEVDVYSGMGVNEGFAIAARSQLSNISAFKRHHDQRQHHHRRGQHRAAVDVARNHGQVQSSASATPQNLNSDRTEHRPAKRIVRSCRRCVGILNTQVGDRYIFSGSAIDTPAVPPPTNPQRHARPGRIEAGDLRAPAGRSRHRADSAVWSSRRRRTTSVKVAEDVAGSPFGLKLSCGLVVADRCRP